jgi:large subunit ribosomal protein L24e
MAGNKNLKLAESAQDVSRHMQLVQPRAIPVEQGEERQRVKEKIKVRAQQRGEMARQMVKGKASAKGGKESRLIPASGGGMGMGMHVE